MQARQEESCLYQWQKNAKFWRNFFVVAPIILGGLASWQILGGVDQKWASIAAALLALLAGFFPAIYEALGMDMRVSEIGQAAAEFTNLRDRFRQAANVDRYGTFEEFKAGFEQLMDRMDAVRKTAPPLPEKFFSSGAREDRSGRLQVWCRQRGAFCPKRKAVLSTRPNLGFLRLNPGRLN